MGHQLGVSQCPKDMQASARVHVSGLMDMPAQSSTYPQAESSDADKQSETLQAPKNGGGSGASSSSGCRSSWAEISTASTAPEGVGVEPTFEDMLARATAAVTHVVLEGTSSKAHQAREQSCTSQSIQGGCDHVSCSYDREEGSSCREAGQCSSEQLHHHHHHHHHHHQQQQQQQQEHSRSVHTDEDQGLGGACAAPPGCSSPHTPLDVSFRLIGTWSRAGELSGSGSMSKGQGLHGQAGVRPPPDQAPSSTEAQGHAPGAQEEAIRCVHRHDPLRWFHGGMVPPALRAAQVGAQSGLVACCEL